MVNWSDDWQELCKKAKALGDHHPIARLILEGKVAALDRLVEEINLLTRKEVREGTKDT